MSQAAQWAIRLNESRDRGRPEAWAALEREVIESVHVGSDYYAAWVLPDGSILETGHRLLGGKQGWVSWLREVPRTPAGLAHLLASPHDCVREFTLRVLGGLQR